jgi:hypothetical protein
MRRVPRLLAAIAALLTCLLVNPLLAGADRAVSPGAVSGLSVSAPEDGETEATQEEGAAGEEEPPVSDAEAEEDGAGEGEEVEAGVSTRRHRAGARCVVPDLQGDSLGAARLALSRAHCQLGKVSEPHGRCGGLVVLTQSEVTGRRLGGGAEIAVRLSAPGKSHQRRQRLS